jgi:hypothetical protein
VRLDRAVLPARRAHRVSQERRDRRGLRERRDPRDRRVFRASPARLDRRARLAFRAKLDLEERPGHLVDRVLPEPLGPPDPLVQPELRDRRVRQAFKEPPARWGPRARLVLAALLALSARPALRASQVLASQARPDPRVRRALLASPEASARPVRQVRKVPPGSPAR